MPARASIDATSRVIFAKAQRDAHTWCKFNTFKA
jgi:hypothetical protein